MCLLGSAHTPKDSKDDTPKDKDDFTGKFIMHTMCPWSLFKLINYLLALLFGSSVLECLLYSPSFLTEGSQSVDQRKHKRFTEHSSSTLRSRTTMQDKSVSLSHILLTYGAKDEQTSLLGLGENCYGEYGDALPTDSTGALIARRRISTKN